MTIQHFEIRTQTILRWRLPNAPEYLRGLANYDRIKRGVGDMQLWPLRTFNVCIIDLSYTLSLMLLITLMSSFTTKNLN